jgi:hypothetical protein
MANPMSATAALLENLIDYAGLFPPAKLPMGEAVARHASYLAGPDRAALGRLIVPLGRLGEFEEVVASRGEANGGTWQLSVITGSDAAADWEIIRAFNARQHRARIVSIETKAATPAQVLQAVDALPPTVEGWVELNPVAPDLAAQLEAVKATGRGAKLRTGGVTTDAFPGPEDILRFMTACRHAGVVFKATAGLHHPLRGDYHLTYEPGSPAGRMFGFLNVFLAAVLLHTGGTETDALALLEDTDAGHFRAERESLTWHQHTFSTQQLRDARQRFCRSFGSCSFTEPMDGLRELHWL